MSLDALKIEKLHIYTYWRTDIAKPSFRSEQNKFSNQTPYKQVKSILHCSFTDPLDLETLPLATEKN